MSMKFKEQTCLERDNNPNGSHEEEIDFSLLVGEHYIARWCDGESEYGYNRNFLYPAYIRGEKGFLKKSEWMASGPYCASGGSQEVVSLEDGIKLLIEKGIYEVFFQDEAGE